MGKLKPCPFCGGEAEFVDCEVNPRWFVRCKRYYCVEQRGIWATKSEAARLWNRRKEAEEPFDRKEFRQFLNDKAWEIANKRAEAKDERTD